MKGLLMEIPPMQMHLMISGRVQNVGFRSFCKRKALELSLSGWVRNRHSGEVEVLAEGAAPALAAFFAACKEGPLWARVSRVEEVSYAGADIPPVQQGYFQTLNTV